MSTNVSNNKEKFVSIREASKLCGLCPQTLRKMADQHTISCYKTPAGQRRFNKADLEKMCSSVHYDNKVEEVQMQNFIYARVSSKKQLDDLNRQITYIRSNNIKYDTYTVISDIASGINFKRQGLSTILDACLQRRIGVVVVAHRDRLSRFGFDLIKIIIEKAGGCLIVIDEQHLQSTEQELAEDLLSIVHIYSCRQMGKRRYCREKNAKSDKNQDKPEQSSEGDIE